MFRRVRTFFRKTRTPSSALTTLTALALAASLAGCAAGAGADRRQRAAQKYSGAFSCTVSISADGRSYAARFEHPSPGRSVLRFTEPATLSTLRFELNRSSLSLRYGALSATTNPAALPQTAMVRALGEAFEAVAAGSLKAAGASGDGTVLSGRTASGRFSLIIAPSLKPRSMSLEDLRTTVRFSDFSFGAAAPSKSTPAR